MRWAGLAALVAVAIPAGAQPPQPSQILVSATGMAKTPPDMVTVRFTLRGEGASSDEAVTNLRTAAAKVSAGVSVLLGAAKDYHSSNFSVTQVRPKECDANNYGQQRLSTGPCAIIGYVAVMPASIDTPRVADAGTLTGLIGRLGGLDAAIENFWLRDEADARRRAMQAALNSAHAKAQSIADGTHAKLGPLMRVQDADYQEMSLDMPDAARVMAVPAPPPPPPPPPPPVRVDMAPAPIQTVVRVMVAYGIER